LLVFGVGFFRKNAAAMQWSFVYSGLALVVLVITVYRTSNFVSGYFCVLLLLLEGFLLQHRFPKSHLSKMVPSAGLGALWFLVTYSSRAVIGSQFTSVIWAMLALLVIGIGLGLKDRIYRWAGFLILCCTLLRIVCFDVWQFQTVYRILSFMGLGLVLLLIGYFYNRYSDRLKKWL
jgi:uncharacterized membrane protein